MFSAALSGFLLGASLIIAIGAQNAFILRQGLLQEHVFILSLICALSDALLITAGVAGLGTLIAQSPKLISMVTLGGAAFLFWYASVAFRRALKPEAMQAARSG
ncbi:LysE family transporter, partial [Escherichia coli]|nr:LysE family transporter [Escherichia coli]